MVSIKVMDPISVPVSVLADLNDLRAKVDALLRENERLRVENERLQRELDQARRSSKRQAAPFSKGPPRTTPQKPGRKSGPAHGRHGHRPPPTPEQIDLTLEAPLPAACPGCGGALRETAVVAQFQTEIPRRPILRQFRVHVGHCRGCGKRVQGRHPLQTSDALGAAAAQIGPDAQAAVAVLNKTFGLSHAKVARLFGSLFGISLTPGASAQIVLRAAQRLEPADEEIVAAIRGSPCLTPDETGWRVEGQSAWLHVWVSPRVVCYAVERDRKADALEEVLGLDWSGTLVHDGFASYDRFTAATHQQCVGHILRRVRELAASATRGAVHFPRQLLALFTAGVHLRNQHLRGQVTAEELKDARPEFDRRLRELAHPPRAVPAYETLAWHLWRHRDEWFTFLEDPEIEPTNWEAEQAIRPAVVNRKVWGGNRTWAGAHAQEVLLSVLETCRRIGRSSLEFVSETLRAYGNPLLPHPVLLTPAN